MPYLILPSLLAADLTRLGEEIEAVIKAGIDMLHFDVMDGHYVPNLSLGPFVCQQVHQRFPQMPIDVHLMTNPVDPFIEAFAKAGATRISIHPETTDHLDRSLQCIRDFKVQAGIAINPATSVDCLHWVRDRLDFVLVMTVNPGFGGQTLIPAVLEKIALIHQTFPDLPIAVDGGVTPTNIARLAQQGATQFVMGSALFQTADYAKTVQTTRDVLKPIDRSNCV